MASSKFRESIHSSKHVLFRKLLTNKRKGCGLSQRQLAEILQEPRSFVSKVEIGDRRLDFIETLKYCKAINLSPYTLVDRLCTGNDESTEISSNEEKILQTDSSVPSCVVTISFSPEEDNAKEDKKLKVEIHNDTKTALVAIQE